MSTESESSESSISETTQSPPSITPPADTPAREPQQPPATCNATPDPSDPSDPTTGARQPPQIVFRTYVPPPTNATPSAPDPPETSEIVRDLRDPNAPRRELTPYHRGIIVGLRIAGLTLDKISRMTGISKGTIHACIKRDAEHPGYQGEPLKKKGRPRKVVPGQEEERAEEARKKRRKVQTVKPPGATPITPATSGHPSRQETGTPGGPPAQENGSTTETRMEPVAPIRPKTTRRGRVKMVPGELNLVFEQPGRRME